MIDFMSDTINYLNEGLGSRKARLEKIANESGVPFETLMKISTGKVKNPRIETVQKILRSKGAVSAEQ